MRKFFITAISLIGLLSAFYFSFWVDVPNVTMSTLWLTFSIISFVLTEQSNIESISIFGNSLKLREIKDTITELRQLSQVMASSILYLEQCQGRFMQDDEDRKLAIYNEIGNVLKEVKIPPEQIREIQEKNWHSWVQIDYVYAIINSVNIDHPAIPKENKQKWGKIRENIIDHIRDTKAQDLQNIFQDLFSLFASSARAFASSSLNPSNFTR